MFYGRTVKLCYSTLLAFVLFAGLSSEARADNTAPYMNGYLGNRNVTVNDTITIDLSVYFRDDDPGDTLTYTHTNPSPNLITMAITGTHTLRIIAGNTPGTSHKIVVTATDRGGLSAQQDFTVTVNAVPTPDPINLSVSPSSISEGAGATTVTVTVIPGGNSSYDVDQTISVSFAGAGGVGYSATPFSFTMAAGTMSASKSFTLTPTNDEKDKDNGTVTVTAAATPSGGSDTETITLTDDDVRGLVFSRSSLSVAENGGSGTYDVKLATMPVGNGTVRVDVASSDTTAATVNRSRLSFTTSNWNTAQEVTVRGVNDDVDNVNNRREVTISHSASGGDYGSESGTVDVSVTDDDIAELVFDKSSLSVAENGGSGTYGVKLGTEPTGTVTVNLAKTGDTGAATLNKSSLSFTNMNWNTYQDVTVTGENDDVDNPDDERTVTISHSASDGGYGGVSKDFNVSVTDDDIAELVFDKSSLSVAENGGSGTYGVKLGTEPTGTVTVNLAKTGDTGAATLNKSSLSFTNMNWNTYQDVTVTGENDDVDNPDDERTVTISHSASDGGYGGVSKDFNVTVTDDDTRGLVFSGTPVSVAEAGDTHTYRVKLATMPTGPVTVSLSKTGSTGAATLSESSLSFTTSNWSTAQEVTVTGVNDDKDNAGNKRSLTIAHSASGGDYGSVSKSASVTVTDDDTRGLVFSGTPVSVAEAGDTHTYDVKLATMPTGPVTISLSKTGSTGAATLSESSLSFTTSNWSTAQEVTVTGVNDDKDNSGDLRELTISHSASGGDYGSVSGTVDVDVTDDDTRGLVFSKASLSVAENGGSRTYDVKLATMPTGTVTVSLSKTGSTDAATLSESSLSFTTSSWDTYQTVRVTGVDDDKDNSGDLRELTISHSASGGDYGSVSGTVDVDVTDDDTRGLVFSKASLEVAENGGSRTYDVKLATEPTGGVTVSISSGSTSVATVNRSTLSFTTSNWSTYQPVRVTGVNDDKDNANDRREVIISHSASGGDYGSVSGTVDVDVTDDDTRGLVFSKASLSVAENGGSGTYDVKLATMPTGTVTVSLSKTGSTDAATLSESSLSFTTSSWDTYQTVRVTGVDDDKDNSGDLRELTISHSASGGDYGSVSGTVDVDVTDDDTRGLVFSRSSLSVAENGGSGTYDVKLATMPTGTVTVSLSKTGSTGAATLSESSLSFTTGNWGTAQEVTVTGVNDDKDNSGNLRELTISHSASGGDYGSVSGTVDVDVTDDDTRGLVFSKASLEVAENGGSGTYDVKLATMPTGTVTVSLSKTGSTGAATLSESSLSFTTGNWGTAQEVTVTGVNDDKDNSGNLRELTISHSASGGDYGSVSGTVDVDVTDDDTRGLVFSKASLEVAENGGSGTYDVKLATMPTGTVTVNLSKTGSTGAATLSERSLSFTTGNWGTAQEVTVTGVNDDKDNAGDQRTVTISHSASGGGYGSVTGDVAVRVTDDDLAPSGITLSVSPGTLSEAAGATSVTVTAASTSGTFAVSQTVTVSVSGSGVSGAVGFSPVSDFDVIIPAGASNGDTTFTLTPVANMLDNVDETVTLSGTASPSGVPVTGASITLTDDDVPSVTIAAVSDTVTEGSAAEFTLTASPVPAIDLSVGVSVSGASRFLSGMTPRTETVSIAAGSSSVALSLGTLDDNVHEAAEAVTATVTAGTGYAPGSPASAQVVVTDDDAGPSGITLSVSPATLSEAAGATSVTVTATVANGTVFGAAQTVTVSVSGSGVSGAVGFAPVSDFDVIIASGASSGDTTFTLTPVANMLDNVDETVTLSGTASPSGVPVTGASMTLTDDDVPSVTIAAVSDTVTEGSAAEFKLAASPVPATQLSVSVSVAGASHFLSGMTPRTETVSIAAGSSSVALSLETVNDDVHEAAAAVTATVTAGTGYAPGSSSSARVVVADNDAAPSGITLSVSPTTLSEAAGATSVTVTATVANGTVFGAAQTVTVSVSGGGVSGAVGFEPVSDFDVVIASGTSSGDTTFTLVPVANMLDNVDETVTLSGTASPSGVPVTGASITLTDDDVPSVTIAAAADTVTEGTSAAFTLTASPVPAIDLSVDVSVSGASDFLSGMTPRTETVSIAAGSSSVALSLGTLDDTVDEAAAAVTAMVLAGTGYAAGVPATANVTIEDDDPTVTTPTGVVLSVLPSSLAEGAGASAVTVTAAPTGGTFAASQTVTVSVSGSGAADAVGFAAVADFTLVIAADSTRGTATFTLTPAANSIGNVDETITISGTVSPATATVTPATLTLTDDDRPTAAPGNLVAASGNGRLDLRWSPVPGASGYEVQYRVRGSAIPNPWPWTDAGSDTTHAIASLSNRTTYIVRVRARNAFGTGPVARAFGTPRAPVLLPAPEGLVVTPGDGRLDLRWSPVPGASGYEVQYRAQGSTIPNPWPWTDAGSDTTHAIASLSNRTTYIVRVRARNASNVGGEVARMYGTPRVPALLPAPKGLVVTPGDGRLDLRWSPVAGASGYEVQYRVQGSTIPNPWPWTDAGSDTTHALTSLSNRTTYIVRVRARNASNVGGEVTLMYGTPRIPALPQVSIAAAVDSVTEGASAAFTVTISSAPSESLTVNISVTGGAGFLTGAVPTGVTIAPGRTTASVSLATEDDQVDEPDGAVTAAITSGNGYRVGSAASARVSISDNDAAPTGIALSVSPAEIAENAGSTTVTVTATPTGGTRFGAAQSVTVTITASGRMNAVSYTSVNTLQVSIAAGASSGSGTFTLLPDDNATGNVVETLTLAGAASPSGAAVSPATLTLTDDDGPAVTISASADSVTEGTSAMFTVTATPAPSESLTVNLSVTGGSGFLAGAVPTSVTIAAGQTGASVTLATEDDQVDEPDGAVTAAVTFGDGYRVGSSASVRVSVSDNDAAPTGIALSVSPAAASEGDSASVVTVTAAPTGGTRFGAAQTVSVTVAGSGASNVVGFAAVAGFDVVIAAGAASRAGAFTLVPVDNALIEADETITVSGTAAPSGATVSPATLTLIDDDLPVITISASADSVTEGADAVFALTASPAPSAALSVNLSISGAAGFLSASLSDTVVAFASGAGAATLSLGTEDDGADEAHAAVTVTVTAGTGYAVGAAGAARVLIRDNDAPSGPPSVPGNFTVTPGPGRLDLSWSPGTGATWYEVQYRPTGSDIPNPWPWTNVGNVTSHTISGLENGTRYWVRLRSANEAGASAVVRTRSTPASASARRTARAAVSAPSVVNAPGDLTLAAGETRTLDVAATFAGDGLTFSASTTDGSVASAAVADGALTVSGLARGTTTLSVTARNGAGAAGYALSVTVTASAAERAAYENVLSAMGRSLLAGARATMEDRFSAIGGQRRLALAGRPVDGVATGVTALIGLAGYQVPRHWNDPVSPGSPGRPDVLRSSSFVYALPGYGTARDAARVTFWGTGSVQAFGASPSGLRYDGGLRTGYVGVDVSMPGLVAGLSVSRTSGAATFQAAGSRGEMATRLTGVYPYARWRSASRPLEIWSILGGGRGEAVAGGESRPLSMRMAMVGLRARWTDLAGIGLSVVGHAGAASLTAPSQAAHTLGDLGASVRQVRLGLEGAARAVEIGVSRLTPFAQVAGRYDGGVGESGSGVEIAGGLRLAAGRLGVEVRGRMLAAHTAESYRERGFSLIAYVRPEAGRSGLSISVAPRWGGDTRPVDMTWREDAALGPERRSAERAGAVRAQVGYGMRYPALGGLVVTPFGEADLTGADRRTVRAGARMGSGEGMMSLELAGERRTDRSGRDQRVGILARMRF